MRVRARAARTQGRQSTLFLRSVRLPHGFLTLPVRRCPPHKAHPAQRMTQQTSQHTAHSTQYHNPSECSKHTTHNDRHTNDSAHANQSPHTKHHRARAQAQRIAHHGQRADGEQDTHRLRVPFKESGQKGTQPAWGKLGRQARKV